MKSFRNFISEEVIPTALVKDGSIDLNREDVRDNLNVLLARAVEKPCVTPYIALNKVRKILDNFHIELPRRTFLEGSRGLEVFDLHQFGHKMGMTDQGEFIKEVPANYFLFLKYESIGTMFVVVAKVLDKAGLDKYLDYAEGSLAEDAQMQQSLSKAKAPKEEPHTALGDCDCGPGDSESTKSAISTSMRKKDKKLSAGTLDEDADIDMEGHKRRIKKLRTDVLEEDEQLDETHADNIRRKYREKEDSNDHTGNVHLLTRVFGSKKERETSKGLLRKRNKQGYVTGSDSEKGYNMTKNYARRMEKLKEAVVDSEKGLDEGTMTGIKLKNVNHDGDWKEQDVMYKSPRMKKAEKLHTVHNAHRGRWGTDDDPGIGSKKSAIASVRTDAAADRWRKRAEKRGYDMKLKEEEQIDELKKSTYVSYIRKASHDVGTQSAATGRYGDRANKALDKYKKGGDYKDWQEHQKNSDVADKAFKKSWKRREGIAKAADRLMKEEQVDEGYASVGHSFDWAGDVNRKARFYGKKPKATTTKNDEKDDTYKGSKQGGRAEKEANKWQKHRLGEDKDPCWKGYDMVGMKKKGGKSVPNCVPVEEEKKPKPVNLSPKQEQDKKIPNSLASYREKIYQARTKQLRKEETISEKAPPGAKFERMVKHIKKGYSEKDGLSKKEKSIAYATAWKAKNREESE